MLVVELAQSQISPFVTLAGSILTRHVVLPNLDRQLIHCSCSCLIVGQWFDLYLKGFGGITQQLRRLAGEDAILLLGVFSAMWPHYILALFSQIKFAAMTFPTVVLAELQSLCNNQALSLLLLLQACLERFSHYEICFLYMRFWFNGCRISRSVGFADDNLMICLLNDDNIMSCCRRLHPSSFVCRSVLYFYRSVCVGLVCQKLHESQLLSFRSPISW